MTVQPDLLESTVKLRFLVRNTHVKIMVNVLTPMILRDTLVIVLTDSLELIARFRFLAVPNLVKTMECARILKIIAKMEGKVKKDDICDWKDVSCVKMFHV